MMSGGPEEVVTIPKHHYQQAIQCVRKQRDKIKQLEYRLKAQDNLSDLLSRKDRELLKLQDTVASLTAGHKVTQGWEFQKRVALTNLNAVNQQAVPFTSSPSQSENVSPDIEEDGAPPALTMETVTGCSKIEVDARNMVDQRTNLCPQIKPRTSISDVKKTAPTAEVSNAFSLESKSAGHQQSGSCSLTLTTPAATTALPGQFSHIVSKDLLGKVMQQNARLKKALREILQLKGLSVTDYLDKVEYEDVIEMLRSDIRRHEAHISHLKNIIDSRSSDELTRLCSVYTTRITELERKVVVLQTCKEHYEEKLSRADSQTAVASSAALSNEMQEENKLLKVKLNCMSDTVTKLQQQIEAAKQKTLELEQTIEELMKNNQKLMADRATIAGELESLKLQYENMETEKQTALSQASVYQEDFNIERKEKCEQKKHYEGALAKHQEWIRQLAAEAGNLREKWTAAEKLNMILQERLKVYVEQQQQRPGGCATAEPWLRPEVLHRLSPSVSTDGVRSSDRSPDTLRCPRCEREFDSSEEAKYKEHCQRCCDE